MRIRSLHHHHSPAGKLNVTPLIDVVMVLIVFYLIVGQLAADRQRGVQLPGSSIGQTSDSAEPITIAILGANPDEPVRVTVNGRETTPDQLIRVLTTTLPGSKSTTVQVRADRRLPYGTIRPVVDACSKAGLTSIKLVTERRDEGHNEGQQGHTGGPK